VGLANIRDRLAQAYGEHHRFEIADSDDPGGGLEVVIEIPFEEREETAAGARMAPRVAVGSAG
jgi:two-component system LytT family sensor kinase